MSRALSADYMYVLDIVINDNARRRHTKQTCYTSLPEDTTWCQKCSKFDF